MWWRLGNDGYRTADELLDDLRLIRRSLAAHGGARVADGRVARLERMVEIFGFHVAKLDIRLHARELVDRTRATRGRCGGGGASSVSELQPSTR